MVLCYKNPWKLIQADSSLGIRIRAGLVRGVQSSFSKTQRREERSKQNEGKENVRRKLSIQRGPWMRDQETGRKFWFKENLFTTERRWQGRWQDGGHAVKKNFFFYFISLSERERGKEKESRSKEEEQRQREKEAPAKQGAQFRTSQDPEIMT